MVKLKVLLGSVVEPFLVVVYIDDDIVGDKPETRK